MLSKKSKKGDNSFKRCTSKRLPNNLFCGKHKNCRIKFNNEPLTTDELEICKTLKHKILPSRNISIITIESFQKNNQILNKLQLYNLKANLQFYNLSKKGKKNELYEKLKKYFETQISLNKSNNEIKLLQAYFRKINHFNLYGPAIGIRSLCHNDNDYLLNEDITDIPINDFFSYYDNNFVYGFTVNSFKQLIQWNVKTNPYNNQNIPQKAIDMLENRLNFMKKNNIYLENYNEPILSDNEKIEQYALDIFHRIDQLGNYTDHRWFLNLNMKSLQKYYATIEDIWFYRAELTNEIKDRISNNNEVFNIKPIIIQSWNSKKKRDLQKLLLSTFDI